MSAKQLHDLARACHNGACNPRAVLVSLGDAIREAGLVNIKDNLDVKYVVGHVSFLLGESLGPSQQVVEEFSRKLEEEGAA
jgi:hypothetical protein